MSIKILEKIFSVKNCTDKLHKILTILGIKLNIRKPYPPIIIPYKKIRMVEVEIFSFCNRRCWFCPNSFIDRHSENILMDTDIYTKVLKDLQTIDYSGIISYSRYNEPFSHLDIFIERLNEARSLLPKALLHTNTNGDYITRESLDAVYDAGLRSLNIQCYLRQNEPFDTENIKNRIKIVANKLDLKYTETCCNPYYYSVSFTYKDMCLNMYARDFNYTGNNRAGSLKTIKPSIRNVPCYVPFTDIYIDHNGLIVPCCNFRSDIEKHKYFIMGDLNKNSILEIFNNKNYKRLRKILRAKNITLYPCNECNFALEHNYK